MEVLSECRRAAPHPCSSGTGYSFKLVSFRICEAQRQKEAAWRTLLLKHHASKASLCSIR